MNSYYGICIIANAFSYSNVLVFRLQHYYTYKKTRVKSKGILELMCFVDYWKPFESVSLDVV